MAVLMGLINTNTLQVMHFPKWVDRRSRTSEQLMCQVVLKKIILARGSLRVDSKREQPKSRYNLELCLGQISSGASHANLVRCALAVLPALTHPYESKQQSRCDVSDSVAPRIDCPGRERVSSRPNSVTFQRERSLICRRSTLYCQSKPVILSYDYHVTREGYRTMFNT